MTETVDRQHTSVHTDPLIGSRLDDYEVVRLIGRGGMARVYEGFDTRLQRRVAIKVITPDFDEDEEITQRFFREARAVANLEHPNIVGVYRFGEGPNLYYMAMRLIEGHTLNELLKSLRHQGAFLPWDRILRIATDVAAALDYAHARNVIHRDIKPSNIMLTADDRAILMDFGLLMERDAGTTFGTAFGTPRYIAPEQAVASDQSVPQSDIYSLGVVLFELMTGRVPFDGESPMATALAHISDPPPLLRSIRPDVPEAVQAVILRALEKAPPDRWPTAMAMADALRVALQDVGPAASLAVPAALVPSAAAVPVPGHDEDLEPWPDSASDSVSMGRTPLLALPGPAPVSAPRPRRRLARFLLLTIVAAGLAAGGLLVAGITAPAYRAAALGIPAPDARGHVRLIYGLDLFAVYNISGEALSLEGLTFARGDLTARFDPARFGERVYYSFPAGQCLRIETGGARTAPFTCGPQIAPQRLTNPDDRFWLPRGGNDTFVVQLRDRTLQTCSARLNTCEFTLP